MDLEFVVYKRIQSYGTIPRIAREDGRERMPRETVSAIMTRQAMVKKGIG